MKNPYLFEGMDSYDTPEGTPVSPIFQLMGKSRWYFYFDNFKTFIQTGNTAKHGKLDGEAQIYYSSKNVRLIERCGGKLHIRGLNHLRETQGKPHVLIGNHMSLLETALLHSIIRRHLDFSYIVKESLLTVPFFKHILLSFNSIPVTRDNPKEDLKRVLSQGKEILKKGCSMIVFPQGTRSKDFDLAKFNTLGVKLAKSAGVPVLPIAIKTDFLDNGKWIKDLGPIHPERDVVFEFGAPIQVEGNGQEANQKCIDFIQSRFENWKSQYK